LHWRRALKGKIFAADVEPDMVRYLGERARREHAICFLGNQAFEPPLETKSAVYQHGIIGTRIRIIYVCRELSGEFGNRSHILGQRLTYPHV
jgi:hypothetical protein